MTPYPLTLQLGMKRFHGHVWIAPQSNPGAAPQMVDEATLQQAVAQHEGSMVMTKGLG